MKQIIALAFGAFVAAPAMAGDQPVIKTPIWDFGGVPVYSTTGVGTGVETVYFTKTNLSGGSATTSGANQPAAVASPAQGRVGGAALNAAETDALYSRLLAEAKSRKLR